jgi:hypothetical protein
MPFLLLTAGLPLALVAAACGLAASFLELVERHPARVLMRVCVVSWSALAGSSVLLALIAVHDWQHLFWSVHFPMLGLFMGSGPFLAGAWPGDRLAVPDTRGFVDRGAALPLSLLVFGVLGLLPLVLLTVFHDSNAPARATGRPLEALVATANYGLGGPVPDLMQPVSASQLARGLGHPPREVTVPMGSTALAALYVTLITWLAMIGRRIPGWPLRRAVLSVAPVVVVSALSFWTGSLGPDEQPLWTNEPWLVRSYGPLLLVAAASLLVLLLAVIRNAWLARRT